MSALASATPQTRHRGLPCSVGVALAVLRQTDPESADDFTAWLNGTGPLAGEPDSAMWSRLQAIGHRVSLQQVGHHRRRSCRCYMEAAA